MPKFGGGLIQITLVERHAAFDDIQISVLPPVVGGSQFAALLQLSSGLILLSCPRQSQPELVMSLGILWLKPRRFPKLSDGFLHFPVAEKCLTQSEARTRKVWFGRDYLTQLFDFFSRPRARV